MTQRPESSGDYGYDLVHEEVSRAKAPTGASGRSGTPGTGARGSSADGSPDVGQDYSYDEAHDF